MDVPILKIVLRPTLTVTSVINTGETGGIYLWQTFWPYKAFQKYNGIPALKCYTSFDNTALLYCRYFVMEKYNM